MAIESVVGPVDRLRGLTLPEEVTLNAIILFRAPGPDGVSYGETDIISESSVPIAFKKDAHRLLSLGPICIPLKTGSWQRAFLLLLDEDGEPFAQGAIRTPDGLPVSGALEAAKAKIQIQQHQRG